MTKEILKQYHDRQQECTEVKERISVLEKQIREIERAGSVKDQVYGGSGGLQKYTIEGFPYPEYSRKKALLYSRKATLCELELEILETIKKIEGFIAEIEDSHIRRIIHLRFIDGLSWADVAKRIGGNTEDSVKKTLYRFLENT